MPINLKLKVLLLRLFIYLNIFAHSKVVSEMGSYETKLQRIREANILMIDDIGAEEVTPWVRDEVMDHYYYRMVQELPTFFIEFKF